MDLLQVIFPVAGIKTYLFIPPEVAFTISFFTSMAGISGAFLLLPFQMSILAFTTTIVAGIIPGVLIGYYIRMKFFPDPKSFKLFVGFVLLTMSKSLMAY